MTDKGLSQVLLLASLLLAACGGGGDGKNGDVDVTQTGFGCLGRTTFGAPLDSQYILPFPVGETSEVLQAYCTDGSHRNQLAYDLIRPFGLDVSAVRSGEVMQVVSHHPDFTRDDVHNNVLIRHDDGTTSFYAHLQQNSIVVAEGDIVFAGQVIGLNGSSGTPTACDIDIMNPPSDQCAILHFGVYATYPPEDRNDIAVNFSNADGPLDARGGLRRGRTYTALSF